MSNATESPGGSAPKFRRRAQHRPDEVLDAAQELFTHKGYAATSVDAIARKAGISKGSIYLYFPSKQAILEGLVTRAIVPVSTQAIAEATTHAGTVRQTLTHILKATSSRLSDPELLSIPKIVIREAVVAPEIADMYRRAVLDKVIPAMIGLIRFGVASGELRDVDPELTVRSVVGPLLMHILMSEIFGIRPAGGLHIDALIDNHLRILFDGLGAGERD